jgi:hypothetical protein
MRVGLSYSVEIEEVPPLVAGLLEKVIDQLKIDTLRKCEDAARNLNIKTPSIDGIDAAIQELNGAKHAFANMDIVLADYINILQGYVGVLKTPPALPGPPASEELEEASSPVEESTE